MKAFLEEYGLVIVIVIVVAMLIFVAVAVSKNGQGKLFGTYNGFTSKGDTALVDGGVVEKEGDKAKLDTSVPEDLTEKKAPSGG